MYFTYFPIKSAKNCGIADVAHEEFTVYEFIEGDKNDVADMLYNLLKADRAAAAFAFFLFSPENIKKFINKKRKYHFSNSGKPLKNRKICNLDYFDTKAQDRIRYLLDPDLYLQNRTI